MKGRFAGVEEVEVQKPRSAEKPTAGVGGTLDYAVTRAVLLTLEGEGQGLSGGHRSELFAIFFKF